MPPSPGTLEIPGVPGLGGCKAVQKCRARRPVQRKGGYPRATSPGTRSWISNEAFVDTGEPGAVT